MSKSSLREQYTIQRARLETLNQFHPRNAERAYLVLVRYPRPHQSRISVIGHTISHAAPDVWKAQGARVRRIYPVRSGA